MSGVTQKHEVLPVIVTEGEEAAHHHRHHFEIRTRAKREMHGGSEGKTEANGGEPLRIKAILVTTTKLTSSPKAPFTVEVRPKTTISKVGVRVNPLGVHVLLSTPVFPTRFFGMEFLVRRTGEGS
jgi:hypothetical protein